MKKLICFLAGALALTPLTSVFCQTQVPPPPRSTPRTLPAVPGTQPADAAALTRFSIDFPGGTPAQLVAAIQSSMGKPMNVIIPTENADAQLPPLRMNGVTVPQLFAALEAVGRVTILVSGNFSGGVQAQTWKYYGFNTSDSPVKDSSIWYFHADRPKVVPTEKVCRFYSLALYLERGFSVDDITTAIQTGWKMSGVLSPPELKYHKETKMLIAFGEADELVTIDSVLRALPSSNATRPELDSMRDTLNDLRKRVKSLDDKVPGQENVNTENPGK